MADPRLARGDFTAEEVETFLRTSGLRHGARIDLMKPDIVPGDLATLLRPPVKVGELTTVHRKSGALVVDFGSSKLGGGLKMQMVADDRLRDTPLQYLVAPKYLLEAPNGDLLEFDQGVYVWNVPAADLVSSEWTVSLADITHFLDTSSPTFGGFSLPDGTRDTDGIKVALSAAAIFDHSGVVESDHTIVGGVTWGHTVIDVMPPGVYGGPYFYILGDHQDSTSGGTRTATLLDICGDLHHGINYYPPNTNRQGVYVAKPAPDIREVDPVAVFGSSGAPLTFRDITTAADISKIANLVYVFTENPTNELGQTGSTFIGIASADLSYPGHPWSAALCQHVLTKVVEDPNATGPFVANDIAQMELAKALSYAQTIKWKSAAHPVLEPYDLVGFWLAGDPQFDTPAKFHLESCSFDLYTGIMDMAGRRIFEPIETGLIVDTGLEEERQVP